MRPRIVTSVTVGGKCSVRTKSVRTAPTLHRPSAVTSQLRRSYTTQLELSAMRTAATAPAVPLMAGSGAG